MKQAHVDTPDLLGKNNRFRLLLIALLILFLVLPVFAGYTGVSAFVNDLGFSVVMLAALYALSENRKFTVCALLLGMPAIILRWLSWFFSGDFLWISGFVFAIGLLLYSALKLLAFLMQVRKVNENTINAAICVYLSLGIAWGMGYLVLEFFQPGAFRLAELSRGPQLMPLEMIYYSMVTLTTLGYGDITPVTPLAKYLSALEAIIGQLYLTVLVARLVNLNISQVNGDQ